MNKVEYNDFEQMFGDMKQYVKTSGHKLEVKDDLKLLQIGFIDSVNEGKWFVMDIHTLETWANESKEKVYAESNFNGNDRVKLILNALDSIEGKNILISIINNTKTGE